MKKSYTKQQIAEAIKHWESVLKRMDESKSPLLDEFAKTFGEDVVFSKYPFIKDIKNINKMFDVFNLYLFDNKLPNTVLIKCLPYNDICKISKSIYDKYKKSTDDEYIPPPTSIYGMHFAVVLNDIFTYNDPLVFADEEILFLNKSNIGNKSFALCAATLCHEMIHYYDRLFGEYKDRYKAYFISNKKIYLHNTPTFELKMKEANDNYIDVVKSIPKF